MSYDFSKNHFELFGLDAAFKIDLERLDQGYRELQSQVHPDKFAHASSAERRLSMQWATLANEAYQTLKRPLDRARYLLHLRGVETGEDTNTAMPPAFLMEQMELRESLQQAKAAQDMGLLQRLEQGLKQESRRLQEELERRLDVEGDLAGAALGVRKLRFLEKLGAEIDEAYEALEPS